MFETSAISYDRMLFSFFFFILVTEDSYFACGLVYIDTQHTGAAKEGRKV
jgi:hypothetical protein